MSCYDSLNTPLLITCPAAPLLHRCYTAAVAALLLLLLHYCCCCCCSSSSQAPSEPAECCGTSARAHAQPTGKAPCPSRIALHSAAQSAQNGSSLARSSVCCSDFPQINFEPSQKAFRAPLTRRARPGPARERATERRDICSYEVRRSAWTVRLANCTEAGVILT